MMLFIEVSNRTSLIIEKSIDINLVDSKFDFEMTRNK